jgi:hypothetical protein
MHLIGLAARIEMRSREAGRIVSLDRAFDGVLSKHRQHVMPALAGCG